jgi:hypothetical protein
LKAQKSNQENRVLIDIAVTPVMQCLDSWKLEWVLEYAIDTTPCKV